MDSKNYWRHLPVEEDPCDKKEKCLPSLEKKKVKKEEKSTQTNKVPLTCNGKFLKECPKCGLSGDYPYCIFTKCSYCWGCIVCSCPRGQECTCGAGCYYYCRHCQMCMCCLDDRELYPDPFFYDEEE